MDCRSHGRLWSIKCVLIYVWCAPVKIYCQLVKVYGVCVILWKQADMVHGFQQWQDRCLHQACPLQMMCGIQTCSAADSARESYRWWQSSLYGTVWAFLVSIGHVTLIKDSSFGAETWLITQDQKPKKGCVIEILSSPSSRGHGSIVISKDDCGNFLRLVFSLSLNSWEAAGWQVIAVDTDVKQVITSWLQTLNSSVFTLEYKPWYHCGTNAKIVVVTVEVMCSICCTCAMYWSKSQ